MKRKITQQLIDWKNRPDHKPLILQGARQVGKTYILEEFGRQHYKNYIKVSLDLVPDVRNISISFSAARSIHPKKSLPELHPFPPWRKQQTNRSNLFLK